MTGNAVVVGGGPAGALLAYLLASRAVSVTLVERQTDFAREFRGEGLAPGGQKMFQEAGLWEPFLALPHTLFDRAALYFKKRPLAAFRLDWHDRLPPRFVFQPAMLEMLIAHASAYPAFRFRRGVRVVGPVVDDDRVVGVDLMTDAGTERVPANYVFASDGRFSAMRKAVGLDQPRTPERFDVVWFKLPMPAFYTGQPVTIRGYFGGGHFGLFIPSYDGRLQVGWVIPKGSYHVLRARGITAWIEEIARQVSDDMAAHLRAQSAAVTHPFLLDVVCDCYQRWSRPGLVLLGDAAHPMSPVGAQGINVALRDAVVAANHFVPVLHKADAAAELDAAAEAFYNERIKEVSVTQWVQRRIPFLLLGRGIWIDATMAGVRGLSSWGLLQRLVDARIRRPNPLIDGVSEIRLRV